MAIFADTLDMAQLDMAIFSDTLDMLYLDLAIFAAIFADTLDMVIFSKRRLMGAKVAQAKVVL